MDVVMVKMDIVGDLVRPLWSPASLEPTREFYYRAGERWPLALLARAVLRN